MTEECKVSVLCTAFNHENYIRDALEGNARLAAKTAAALA